MKKVAALAVCAIVVLAGVFAVGGSLPKRVFADEGDEPIAIPSGLVVYYYDSLNENPRPATRGGSLSATYWTTGCLYIVNGAEETVFDEKLTVTRLSNKYSEEMIVSSECDYNSQADRLEYSWFYESVGIYRVTVTAWVVLHEHTELCYDVHEDCGDPECEEEIELICDIEEKSGPGEFSFDIICNSRTQPRLQVIYTLGNEVNDDSSPFYSDVKQGFCVKAVPRELYFFWDEDSVIYSSDDPKLTVSDGGKTLLLNAQPKGGYTINFEVSYSLVKVDSSGGVTVDKITEVITEDITFVNRPRPATIWDVVLGVAVLGVLGAAAYLASKLSKGVEKE